MVGLGERGHLAGDATLVEGGQHRLPRLGQVEAGGTPHRLIGERHALHPTHPEGPQAGVGVGDQVPGLAFGHEAEGMDGPLAGLSVATRVSQPDLDAVDDRLLQGGEMSRRLDRKAVPVRCVDDHRLPGRLGTGAEGLGQGPDELSAAPP